jgi:hypothetical protein
VKVGYNLYPGNGLVKNTVVNGVAPGVALAEVTHPAQTIEIGEAGHEQQEGVQAFRGSGVQADTERLNA